MSQRPSKPEPNDGDAQEREAREADAHEPHVGPPDVDEVAPVQLDPEQEGPRRTCPTYEPGQLERVMGVDRSIKVTLIVVLVLGVLLASTAGWGLIALALAIGALVLLLRMGTLTAKVSRDLPHVSAMLDSDPASAEAWLAHLMMLPGLDRISRIVLYHRLAVLRHRTSRHAEAHEICQALMRAPKVAQSDLAPHLVLIMAEARLIFRDLPGCYLALSELHRQDLGLVERLQLLALQTRYEMACNQLPQALYQLPAKLELIDLMPNRQAAPMHGLLAVAADRTSQPALAHWLRQRGQLLGDIDHFPIIAA